MEANLFPNLHFTTIATVVSVSVCFQVLQLDSSCPADSESTGISEEFAKGKCYLKAHLLMQNSQTVALDTFWIGSGFFLTVCSKYLPCSSPQGYRRGLGEGENAKEIGPLVVLAKKG